MTEWITPKTDWETGDYYNLEDAERLINNLKVLKELASAIYPNEVMYFLIKHNSEDYYERLPITISEMEIFEPSSSDSVATFLKKNLEILWKFCLLRWGYIQGQTGIDYPIPYYDGNESESLYMADRNYKKFKGYGYYSPYLTRETIKYVGDIFQTGRCAFFIALDLVWDSYYIDWIYEMKISSNIVLKNTKFYDEVELNQIESAMIDVYNFLIDLQNSYPPA